MGGMKRVILLVVLLSSACSQSLRDTRRLLDYLKMVETNGIRPRMNQSETLEINVQIRLYTIVDYHVSDGKLTLSLLCAFRWIDETKTWKSSEYNGLTEVRMRMKELWMPNLYLSTVLSGDDRLISNDDSTHEVVVRDTGEIETMLNKIVDVYCEPDISKYPFDEHVCKLHLYGDRPLHDVCLITDGGILLTTNVKNSKWRPVTSEFNISVKDGFSNIQYILQLKRNPAFLTMNIVLPIVIMTIATPLVFLLPEQSGERLSYSSTIFLSFIVFVSSSSNILPEVSEPISYFNTFLVIQLVYSAHIMVAVIVVEWLNNKTVSCFSTLCKKKKNGVECAFDNLDETTPSKRNGSHNIRAFVICTLLTAVELMLMTIFVSY